jgi:serine phosphatase RsbU (regulator of sigma subunit)
VYAERAIPANRRVPVESNSAFSDLDFATYLGTAQVPSALATTDVPADQLPLRGDTDSETIPFGNSTVLLVAAAHGHLGGPLGQEMPWVFLLGGIVLTAGAAATAHHLVVRRRKAEGDARTIAGLYGKLGSLYGEQRSIAVALQHALLPAFNPTIAGLEIASRYVAGARGVDIGGDWFSIVRTDEHHFAFVIGDVSGRGVSAATIMARLRYTIRAYLLEGHPPEHVLDMCARQLDIEVDGHFATILVGVGDLRTRELVLANAGHFDPLVITGTDAAYVVTTVGVPLGISDATYTPTVVTMPPGSTLLAFTDGLVERRGESIDDGLDRLRAEAKTPDLNLDHTLDRLITELTDHQSEDDIALLAFRWR